MKQSCELFVDEYLAFLAFLENKDEFIFKKIKLMQLFYRSFLSETCNKQTVMNKHRKYFKLCKKFKIKNTKI